MLSHLGYPTTKTMPELTIDDWLEIEQELAYRWNFPNGDLDG